MKFERKNSRLLLQLRANPRADTSIKAIQNFARDVQIVVTMQKIS